MLSNVDANISTLPAPDLLLRGSGVPSVSRASTRAFFGSVRSDLVELHAFELLDPAHGRMRLVDGGSAQKSLALHETHSALQGSLRRKRESGRAPP